MLVEISQRHLLYKSPEGPIAYLWHNNQIFKSTIFGMAENAHCSWCSHKCYEAWDKSGKQTFIVRLTNGKTLFFAEAELISEVQFYAECDSTVKYETSVESGDRILKQKSRLSFDKAVKEWKQ